MDGQKHEETPLSTQELKTLAEAEAALEMEEPELAAELGGAPRARPTSLDPTGASRSWWKRLGRRRS